MIKETRPLEGRDKRLKEDKMMTFYALKYAQKRLASQFPLPEPRMS